MPNANDSKVSLSSAIGLENGADISPVIKPPPTHVKLDQVTSLFSNPFVLLNSLKLRASPSFVLSN